MLTVEPPSEPRVCLGGVCSPPELGTSESRYPHLANGGAGLATLRLAGGPGESSLSGGGRAPLWVVLDP